MHFVQKHAILCKLFACSCLTSLNVGIPLPCLVDPPFELGFHQLPVCCAFLLAFALLKLADSGSVLLFIVCVAEFTRSDIHVSEYCHEAAGTIVECRHSNFCYGSFHRLHTMMFCLWAVLENCAVETLIGILSVAMQTWWLNW